MCGLKGRDTAEWDQQRYMILSPRAVQTASFGVLDVCLCVCVLYLLLWFESTNHEWHGIEKIGFSFYEWGMVTNRSGAIHKFIKTWAHIPSQFSHCLLLTFQKNHRHTFRHGFRKSVQFLSGVFLNEFDFYEWKLCDERQKTSNCIIEGG